MKKFNGEVLIGMVVLKPIPIKKVKRMQIGKGIEKESPKATIVGIGGRDEFKMDPKIRLGTTTIIPKLGKQEFKKDGEDYIVVHHRELKVLWTNEDRHDEQASAAQAAPHNV